MSEPMSDDKLKPCPFCGGVDVRPMPQDCSCGLKRGILYVRCYACGSNGPVDEDRAVSQWNNARYWKVIRQLREALKGADEVVKLIFSNGHQPSLLKHKALIPLGEIKRALYDTEKYEEGR